MNDDIEADYIQEKNEKYEINALREKILSLERFLSSSKLQLLAQNKRCENLQEKVSSLVQDNLELQKSLTEAECKYDETKKELEGVSKEYQSLVETNCELEITIEEGTVQEQVLKENIDELEDLCSTLRKQRDEQNSYFRQKEECLKNKYQHLLNESKQEKSKVLKELSELKMENVNLNDEVQHLRNAHHESSQENMKLRDGVDDLTVRLRKAEKDLLQEKATVQGLSHRNNELADVVSELHAKKLSTPDTSLPKETVSMIEDLVKKFYEKKSEAAAAFSEVRAKELSKQVSNYEIALSTEKRRREKLEFRLEEAEKELLKARSDVDSMFELSVKRTRASLNRCDNLRSSLSNASASTSSLRSPLLDITQLCNDATISADDVTHSLTASKVSDATSDVSHASEALTSVSTNSDLLN